MEKGSFIGKNPDRRASIIELAGVLARRQSRGGHRSGGGDDGEDEGQVGA